MNEYEQELIASNDCLVDVLESYMEFIDIFERITRLGKTHRTDMDRLWGISARRKKDWLPILETVKSKQEECQKSVAREV